MSALSSLRATCSPGKPGQSHACAGLTRILWGILLSALLLVSPAPAQWWQRESQVTEAVGEGSVNWTEGVVRHRERRTGSGQQASALHLQASDAARQRLLQVLSQLRLDATRTLGEAWERTPAQRHAVEALLPTAEVVETSYGTGGSIESTVQLSLTGRLTALFMPPPAPGTAPAASPLGPIYTGVVIDARGLDLRPALFPRLVDEQGRVLYAPEEVDPEAARQHGYVIYARVYDQGPGQTRVGERPLVLRAQRVASATRVDLVLARSEAAQIADYPTMQRLLQRCQVLIIM